MTLGRPPRGRGWLMKIGGRKFSHSSSANIHNGSKGCPTRQVLFTIPRPPPAEINLKLRDNLWRTWLAAIFGFALPLGVTHAQELPTLLLKNTEVKQLRGITDEPITGPIRCDSAGNIYLRTYQEPDSLASPVRRFTQQGKWLPELSLSQREEFKNKAYQIRDFQTGNAGNTFFLVNSWEKNKDGKYIGPAPIDVSVVEFDENGKPETVTKLDAPAYFSGGQLGVFPDGKFIVGGSKVVHGPEYLPQKGVAVPEVYIASFNQDGHLIAEFHPTPPPAGKSASQTHDAGKTAETSTQEKQGNAKEPWSGKGPAPEDMVVGQDGRAYFFHKDATPVIYVVTENGEFERQFFVPLPSANAKPWHVRSLPGLKLLADFIEDVGEDPSAGQIHYLDIIDSQSGETISRYKRLPTEGGIFVCYSEPYDFVFLGGDPQGFTTIVHASPK
jgi:hypothetical protein